MVMYVIAHKQFEQELPKGYQKLLVGAEGKKGKFEDFLKDNTGENISVKNPNYCELTGIYWLWKNSKDKNIGISHYRRFFTEESLEQVNKDNKQNKQPKIIEIDKLNELLNDADWIVPTQVNFGYWHFKKVTLYNQYVDNHPKEGLLQTREVISEKFPEYLADFDKVVMNGNSFTPLNMMYTDKKKFDKYCEWLFEILFEVEKRVDISSYDAYQARIFGFISERLLEVYLVHNNFKLIRLNVFNTELSNSSEKEIGSIHNTLREISHAIRWH